MLKMKPRCEKCETATGPLDEAWICSYECTFCRACTEQMNHTCPNCSGVLVLRPTRARKPLDVGLARAKKLFGGGKT